MPAEVPWPNLGVVSQDKGMLTANSYHLMVRNSLTTLASDGSPSKQALNVTIIPSFPGQFYLLPPPTSCFPHEPPGVHGVRPDKPVLRAVGGEKVASWCCLTVCGQPPWTPDTLCLCLALNRSVCLSHRSPNRSTHRMAATDFVQEMRSVGERLLKKLRGLPQAEPVELVAFSIIILFTGKWGTLILPSAS